MLQDAVAYSCAMFKDQEFISTYAMSNPYVEDVAESFPIWYAARYKTSKLDQETKGIIEDRIPNRLEYFDQKFKDAFNWIVWILLLNIYSKDFFLQYPLLLYLILFQ